MNLQDKAQLAELGESFRSELTDNILPFWLRYGLDRELGGITTGLSREGKVIESDKSVWFQGRAAWTFSTAYREVEPRGEYLEAARSCIEFLGRHCFDADGRMFFRVARDGSPVIKRKRYVFSEAFAIMGMAAYSRASGNAEYADKARDLFDRIENILSSGILEPKFNAVARPSRSFALEMILLSVAQELRKARPKEKGFFDAYIDGKISAIETLFMNRGHRCVLEQAGPAGEFQDAHIEGRLLNPGHAIEGAWFILREAIERGNEVRLRDIGTTMLDWMWEWGWDKTYGGIYYFRDALDLPPSEYWHDMKFWWPQNEAVIATLMAYALTGETRFAERFSLVYDWAASHFPDPEYGEWYGYLHRDGTVSTTLKGNMYKGPFHIPRMFMLCRGIILDILRPMRSP
jgi:N-acylglucosamine 2-epimerase